MVYRGVFPKRADLVHHGNPQGLPDMNGRPGIQHGRMRMQEVRPQLPGQFSEPRLGRLHHRPLVDDRQPTEQTMRLWRAMEAQAVRFLFQPLGIDLLGAGEVMGLPPQAALATEDVGAAEGVTGMQRQRMVKHMQDAQAHTVFPPVFSSSRSGARPDG